MEIVANLFLKKKVVVLELTAVFIDVLLYTFDVPYAFIVLSTIELEIMARQTFQFTMFNCKLICKETGHPTYAFFSLLIGLLSVFLLLQWSAGLQIIRLLFLFIIGACIDRTSLPNLVSGMKQDIVTAKTKKPHLSALKDCLFEYIDQGYFICVKSTFIDEATLAAPYINKKGQEIMKEHNLTFSALCNQLIEIDDPNRSLRTIVEEILKEQSDNDYPRKLRLKLTKRIKVKCRLNAPGDSNFDATKAFPFKNFRGKIYRISKTEAIIVLSERCMTNNLQMADNLKKTVVCTLSHELKTLLNGVIGNLDLLEGVKLEGEHKQSQKAAACSSRLLDYKIKDLFDYIQLQNKEFKLHCEEFELEGIIEEVKIATKWIAKQKEVKVESKLESLHSKTMIGDRNRITQIILNLLTKEIELTEYGSKVQIHICRTKANKISFSVRSFGSWPSSFADLDSKNIPSSRRNRSKTLCDNEFEQVTQNLEALSLQIAQLICKEMDSNIVAKAVNGVYAELKFSVKDGFFPKRIKDFLAKTEKVRRKTDLEKKSTEEKTTQILLENKKKTENDLLNKSFCMPEKVNAPGDNAPSAKLTIFHQDKDQDNEIPEQDIPSEFIQRERISIPLSQKKLVPEWKQTATMMTIHSPLNALPHMTNIRTVSPPPPAHKKNSKVTISQKNFIIIEGNGTQLIENDKDSDNEFMSHISNHPLSSTVVRK